MVIVKFAQIKKQKTEEKENDNTNIGRSDSLWKTPERGTETKGRRITNRSAVVSVAGTDGATEKPAATVDSKGRYFNRYSAPETLNPV